jgi:hypothetical protein
MPESRRVMCRETNDVELGPKIFTVRAGWATRRCLGYCFGQE